MVNAIQELALAPGYSAGPRHQRVKIWWPRDARYGRGEIGTAGVVVGDCCWPGPIGPDGPI